MKRLLKNLLFILLFTLFASVLCIYLYVYHTNNKEGYIIRFSDMDEGIYYHAPYGLWTYDRSCVNFPSRCFSLKYTLNEIEKEMGGFHFPSRSWIGDRSAWPYMESYTDVNEKLCQNTLSSSFRKLLQTYPLNQTSEYFISALLSCDYYSHDDGICLRSPYLGLFPTKGTYMIHGNYYEICEDGWRHVIPTYKNAPPYDYLLYSLKAESIHKNITELREEDFYFLYKKEISEPVIETLPFGTYMMLTRLKDGHILYFIVSVNKA